MLRLSLIGSAAVALLALSHSGVEACGPDTDCVIGERTYRIALPEGDGPFGAIVYLHGWRGTAAGVMNNGAMREMAADLKVALVAAKSGGEDWLIRNAPRKGFVHDRRETAYFDALVDEITTKFPIDGERLLATGFSAGGMMTWTLACRMPERFAGFLPVAGTFWAPLPDDCGFGDAPLIHIHGTSDTVVPLNGRPIADTRQGEVSLALAALRARGAGEPQAQALAPPEPLRCDGAAAPGGVWQAQCLHDGGHVIRPEWLAFGYRALVAGQ
ncbi:MAG: prolyl oligopeptidase family serine peptidase [Pseudomonadota bacterium]